MQTQTTLTQPQPLLKYLAWALALIPALGVDLVFFNWKLDWWISLPVYANLLLQAVPVILLALIVNAIVPLAVDRRTALLFALPALLAHFYYFTFQLFTGGLMSLMSPNDSLTAANGMLLLAAISVPLELIFFAAVALAARAGGRLRKPH